MERKSSGLIVLIVFLGVLVGIAGGGLVGGVAGFYAARQSAAANAVMTNPVPVSNVAPAAPSPAAPPTGPSNSPATQNVTVNENSAVIDAVKKVEPAVVTVISTLSGSQRSPFGNPNSPQASGSGVAIDNKGYIVTNNHVIDGATKIEVVFQDGSNAPAKLVGADPVSDLAVIQVDKVPAVAALGDSNALLLGQTVIAIGSPLGSYRGSVTRGVVSGMNRRVEGTDQEGLIQTDAAINHGNSGGPLVNDQGQIVGINTLVVRDTNSGDVAEGLGFAIPSNTVKQVTDQLIATGNIQYPYIGIVYNEVTPDVAAQMNLSTTAGIVVQSVVAGSPAQSAGMRPNDVVTAINGKPIDQNHSLRSYLYGFKPGDTVTLSVVRGSQKTDVQIKLTNRPTSSAGAPG